MKNLIKSFFLGIFLLISQIGFSQLRGINYQAVAIDEEGLEIAGMDINGQAIRDKTIAVRFSILSGGEYGAVLYQEIHTTNTDPHGLFSLIIGDGIVTGGTYIRLIDIPWSTADQFLKVELDIKNDGNFKLMSIQQFMAVPYAFYALNSGNYYELELTADAQNGITIPFTLTATSKIYINGCLIANTRWTGATTTTLNVNMDTKKYDQLVVEN